MQEQDPQKVFRKELLNWLNSPDIVHVEEYLDIDSDLPLLKVYWKCTEETHKNGETPGRDYIPPEA